MKATSAFLKALGIFIYTLFTKTLIEGWKHTLYRDENENLAAYRTDLALLQSHWGSYFFEMTCEVMNITVVNDNQLEDIPKQCLVISNHRSSFDILIIFGVLRKLGIHNARWVIKNVLRHAPVIGRLCVESGCAFIKRFGDPRDQEIIRQKAMKAREEGASMIIFPEGTRFNGKPGEGFKNMLWPRPRGFSLMQQQFSDMPVLMITHYWEKDPKARTLLGLSSIYGSTLHIRLDVTPATQINDPSTSAGGWLISKWKEIDQLLPS